MRILARSGLCAVVLAAVLCSPAVAQTEQDNTGFGTSSGEFLLLGAGARGTALGGSVAALTTDVTALYYNPGDLALITQPAAVVSTYSYLAGTRYSWAGLAFPLSGGARLSLERRHVQVQRPTSRAPDQPDGTGETYSVAQTFIGGTYSQNFSDRFSAGLTAKFISDKPAARPPRPSPWTGTNFHASLGQRPIRAAFVIQNLGTPLKHTGPGLDETVLREPPLGTQDVPQQEQPASATPPGPFRCCSGRGRPGSHHGAKQADLARRIHAAEQQQARGGGGLEYALSASGPPASSPRCAAATRCANNSPSAPTPGSVEIQRQLVLELRTGGGRRARLGSRRLQSRPRLRLQESGRPGRDELLQLDAGMVDRCLA
jgi:hypothetical protein